MNAKSDEKNDSSEKASTDEIVLTKKKRAEPEIKKIAPSTITKLVRSVYSVNPKGVLELSPELFRILSEEESSKKAIDRSYFENYVTEREKDEFLSQLTSIIKKENITSEDAIKILELVAALRIEKESIYRTAVKKSVQILGIDLHSEKDSNRLIRHGEVAHRMEILRGVLLGIDWSGRLLEISLLGKDIKIYNVAESFIGCLSLEAHEYDTMNFTKTNKTWAKNKTVVFDKSAFISILNKDCSAHKILSAEFLNLIDNRVMIVCPMETLLDLLSYISYRAGVSIAQEIHNKAKCFIQLVGSLTSAKKLLFDYALSAECKGLEISSLYAILLSKMIDAPLFTSDNSVMTAYEIVIRNYG